MTEKVERRLAAILSADVVGYSRLVRAEEEGTVARLSAHLEDRNTRWRAHATSSAIDSETRQRRSCGMLVRCVLWLMRHSPFLRRLAWRTFHESLGRRFGSLDRWTFMNYGYAELHERAPSIPMEPGDEGERYCAQLYSHVTEGVDLVGCDVLEVGCGRGGGVSYMAQSLNTHRVTGLDIAGRQVEFCRRVHRDPKVVFVQGDAERLVFDDASFDAIVNVESSFSYGRLDVFLAEVERVLKPGGYFLFADIRLATKVDALTDQLARAGLIFVRTEDISANVSRALELDAGRRRQAAETLGSAYGWGVMPAFIGVEGTRIPTLLSSGALVYLSVTMRKPGDELDASAPGEEASHLAAERDFVSAE